MIKSILFSDNLQRPNHFNGRIAYDGLELVFSLDIVYQTRILVMLGKALHLDELSA
jgi:hypothetical protein